MKSAEIQWLEPEPVNISTELLLAAGGDRILAEALSRRGFISMEQAVAFLDPAKYIPALPAELPELEKAVERLAYAISAGELIGIWGDFDADGQTSTAILYSALQALGAKVIYHIPVRARESHGISLPGLKIFLDRGVELILTCDTGVSAHNEVEFGRNQGVDFIITDHHTLPAELPSALAVVNPQRLPENHPLYPLCGAGTALKLVEGLYAYYGRPEEASQFFDLAALGTVADLASLTGDNRYIVQMGLEQIRRNPRPAIKAMLDLGEINYTQLSEEHIGYILGPRLNALGRLADANPAVPFLIASEIEDVIALASQMETLNNQRKLLSDQVFQAAQAQIQQDSTLLNGPVLVLNHPNWPAGVIGISASRLVEVYQKPVILIACPSGELGRASARSIIGINITAALAANKDYLVSFGGHSMAAGFAIDAEEIPQFRSAINQTVREQSGEIPIGQKLAIDLILPLEQLTLELVGTLDRLSPYGPGNPSFTLAAHNLVIKSFSPIGKSKEHLQIIVEDPTGAARKIIWWQGAGFPLPDGHFDLAFAVRASNYRGERSVQIEWINARLLSEENTIQSRRPSVESLDFRSHPDPAAALKELQATGVVVVWQEGEKINNVTGSDRYHLNPCQTLALWNIPPGLNELRAVLDAVQPSRVVFFGLSSASDQLSSFLPRLAGLIRFALNKRKGQITIPDLAAATVQRERTIHKGIDWWSAHGEITQSEVNGKAYTIIQGGIFDQNTLNRIELELIELLQETSAFRSYFLRADPRQLLE